MTASTTLDTECVVLAHGGGGELTGDLIRNHFLPRLRSRLHSPLADSAVVPWSGDHVVYTTDSFVVTPLEFPGGDIGRLAVCGTVNDLAVMGATPIALSLGLILEEGLPLAVLDRVIRSIADACAEANVDIVTGDTKVVERHGGGGLFINTSGIGRLRPGERPDVARIAPGDAVIVSDPLAEHGLAILSARGGITFDTDLRSDAAPLNGLIDAVLDTGAAVKFMRDPTRGGLAGVMADICEHRRLSVEIEEGRLPITPTARHAAEMLGLDPLSVANEGKIVLVAAPADADRVVATLRAHPLGRGAAVIGRVVDSQPTLVELLTRAGGRRIIQRPYGEELPRIC